MMNALEFSKIQKTVSDVNLGYTVPTTSIYSQHVRALIAERKELMELTDKLTAEAAALREENESLRAQLSPPAPEGTDPDPDMDEVIKASADLGKMIRNSSPPQEIP